LILKKAGIIISALIALSLIFTGCPATISQEDYDALKAERDAKIAELAAVQADLTDAQNDTSDLGDQLDLVLEEITDLKAEIDALTIRLAEAELAAVLSMPVPLSPADRSVFDHFPRTTTFKWEPSIGDGPITYYLEIQYSWAGDDADFGSWAEGDHEGGLRITSDTQYTMNFYGAQPGRWRVKATNSCGESIWSPWQYFRYTS
jgi:hypothetical protein